MKGTKRCSLVPAGLLIAVLVLITPAAAATITIDNSSATALSDAVTTAARNDDTIILEPGTYFENGIVITGKNLTLRASDGHGPEDTIIDGRSVSPRIFTVSGDYSLTLDNLMIRNGRAGNGGDGGTDADGGSGSSGGAILSDGTVVITSSVITNCLAGNGGKGGTRSGRGGNGGSGGAISSGGPVTILSSVIIGCSAGSGGTGGSGGMYTGGGAGGNGGNGGGVSSDGAITVTLSTITGCSAGAGGTGGAFGTYSSSGSGGFGGSGGALFSSAGGVILTSTGISGCRAGNGGTPVSGGIGAPGGPGGSGGAVSSGGAVTMILSDITGCTSGSGGSGSSGSGAYGTAGDGGRAGSGGAVSSDEKVTMTSSAITSCSAGTGGKGGSGGSGYSGGAGNSGGSGGAVSSAGMVDITLSTIASCSAGAGGNGGNGGWGGTYNGGWGGNGGSAGSGGAVSSAGMVDITLSTITGCTAGAGGFGGSGGMAGSPVAPDYSGGNGGSGSSGGSGGALSSTGEITITSSTLAGCSAAAGGSGGPGGANDWGGPSGSDGADGSAGTGGAVNGPGTIRFCRLVNNDYGTAVVGRVAATDNWWGSNGNPSSHVGSSVTYDPWLVLGITASPPAINNAELSGIRANLTFDMTGAGVSYDVSGFGQVPDGIPVAYTFTGTGGSLGPAAGNMTSGGNTTMFSMSVPGAATVDATVDGQTVSVPVTVTMAPAPAISAFSPASGSALGGTPVTITGTGFYTGSTTVTFGGLSAAGLTVNSPGSITAVSPRHAPGSVPMIVTTPGGSVTATDPFTYYPGPAFNFSVSASSPVTAGSSSDVTVTALDAAGNTATGYTGTVHFTSNDSTAVLPVDTTLTNGAGTFSAVLNTAGPRTITVTDRDSPVINGSSNPVTVNPAAATRLSVSAPASASAGSSFSFTVTALDPYGNTATGYTGTVHFTSSDSTAILPSDAVLTNGVGSLSATLNTVGSRTLTATGTGSPPITGTSGTITVNPGAPVRFNVAAPASSDAGILFSGTITVFDGQGNTVTDYDGTVQFTSSDAAATLPGNTRLSGGTGPFAATLTTAGHQTLTATDTVTSSVTGSGTVLVNPAAASRFTLVAPASSAAGSSLDFTVTARDPYGNTATGYGGTVNFTSTDGAATLPADAALAGGTGTFSAILKTSGSETITAADTITPAITGTSGAVIVSPGPASALTVTAPASVPAYSPFTVTITARDAYGNLVPGNSDVINVTSTDPVATLPADAALTGGTGSFPVCLKTLGTHIVTGTDTITPSITGTSGAITVTVPVVPAPTAAVTPVPVVPAENGDDAFPPTPRPPATDPVNVGGNSAVRQVTVTGTGIGGLVITGLVQPGPGRDIPLPPGIVYQYLTLDPVGYTTITGALITFSVPESWLSEHQLAPAGITMYHNTGGEWVALPTTVTKAENGMVWFSAASPGFSLFAITGTGTGTANTGVVSPANPVPADTASSPAAAIAGRPDIASPVASQTIAAPAPAAPGPGFPFATVAMIGVGCGVLIGSGWYVRRWWIRRQNPALFEEY